MEKTYKNLGYFFLLLIPLTILAFYKTYFVKFPDFEDTTLFIHIHAAIATLWILMLIIQPLLIRSRKFQLHRKMGKLSYILFPLLILSFVPQMINIINSDAPNGLFFPLADSIMLTICYSLSIYHRKDASRHMRYMIGTAVVFLGPTIGRIGVLVLGWSGSTTQMTQYGLIYFILLGLLLVDKKNGKAYKPYAFMLVLWILHQATFTVTF